MVCVYYYHRFTRGIGTTEPILLWEWPIIATPNLSPEGNEAVVFKGFTHFIGSFLPFN